jgi:hypothetical protein
VWLKYRFHFLLNLSVVVDAKEVLDATLPVVTVVKFCHSLIALEFIHELAHLLGV